MSTTNKPFDIGQRIHELRTNRRLSQEQLALRSNITPTYLGLIERNLKNPTLKVIEQLCNALNISLADFSFLTQHKMKHANLIIFLSKFLHWLVHASIKKNNIFYAS